MNWKANLAVLWFGTFVVMAGMTMIIPFVPYYIQEMGVTDADSVAMWAGVIFAANFVTAFLFQPIWGRLADRHGRKIMVLRSGFGMAVVMALMGLAATPWQLLLLRMLNGTISGYIPAAVSLISASTPREKMGFTMGVLQSGQVAGTILGPLIGGVLADWVGYRPIFYITSSLLFVATLTAALLVKEKFDKQKAMEKPNLSLSKGFAELARIRQLTALFAVTFMIQFALMSSMPLIPVFIQEMHPAAASLAFLAGLVASVTGLSNMIASPLLGRLSDKLGPERILRFSLIGACMTFIPQAFVHNVWQLLVFRFLMGVFIGGLIPSVNALIRQYTPDGMESRAYSFNTSFLALGNVLGPTLGGLFSGWAGIRPIFLIAACLFAVNAYWVYWSLFARRRQASS
ncbi:MFS transporter [Xylanibacillus composti]|uniref:MFS transporter n=1 Tax=Xylanibacillus composti TaxID=1572762 RepID=A0A8J4M0U5_9BACL|nr:MFS transporter [Xylanibacillus composti]MDT9724924.1 MFS transporter [Xylanibacillus composti]GIQ68160.1 MFS transporter [Xylanibacillus composti]